MGVKLKDVKGLMITEVKCKCVSPFTPDPDSIECKCGARQMLDGLTQQGSRSVTLNRDALSKTIWDRVKFDLCIGQDYCDKVADAILADLPNLLESVTERKEQ